MRLIDRANDKLKQYYNYKLNGKQHRMFLFLSLIVTFIAIYVLNVLQPLFTDDWEYSFTLRLYDCANKGSIPDVHISSIADIITSQYEHYFAWGGRCVNHFLAQFLLYIGAPYNKVLNSLAYVAFTYLICLVSARKGESVKLSSYFLVNVLIFFFVPVLGSTLLWITGSANYLWGTLILLLFLLPYKRLYESCVGGANGSNSLFKAFYLFVGGIVAGWTNENMVAASIFMILVFFVYARYQKWQLPMWFYSGFAGFLIGFLLMVLAPGNYVRYEQTLVEQGGESLSKISVLVGQFMTAVSGVFFYLVPAITTFLVLLLLSKYWKREKADKQSSSVVFFVIAMVAALVMAFSPVFPERAWFGIIIFIIIAILMIYNDLNFDIAFLRDVRILLFCIFGIALLGYYLSGYKDLSRAGQVFAKRAQMIEEQKKKGVEDFVFDYEIKSKSRINNLYDLSNDPTYWTNCFYARYYGVNSVRVVKPECK